MRKLLWCSQILLWMFILTSCAAKDNWTTFTPPGSGVSVMLPGTPTANENSMDSFRGKIVTKNYTLDMKSIYYIVSITDIPPYEADKRSKKQILDDARDGGVANADGTLKVEKEIKSGGYEGRELIVDSKNSQAAVYSKIFLVGNKLVVFVAATYKDKEESPEVRKFLDSINLS